jgi:hypothetical protein
VFVILFPSLSLNGQGDEIPETIEGHRTLFKYSLSVNAVVNVS